MSTMTPTADDLLPELKSYLGAIAEAHGEPVPEYDSDVMHSILEGLLEQSEDAQADAEALSLTLIEDLRSKVRRLAAERYPDVERLSMSPEELDEHAEYIADLLYGLYGEQALEVLQGANDEGGEGDAEDASAQLALTRKPWNPLHHPRDKKGMFVKKGTPEAIAAAREAVGKVLAGDHGAAHAESLLEHLGNLTVKQLKALHKEHGKPAPKALRDELVASVKERLAASEAAAKDKADREAAGTRKVFKARGKAATGDTLYRIVQTRGGINLDDLRKNYNVKEDFIEFGLRGLLTDPKKGKPTQTLDDLAQTLHAEGHINVPEGETPSDHLLAALKEKAKSNLRNLDSEIEAEYKRYIEEESHARAEAEEHGDDPASVGASLRDSEAAGEAEASAGDAFEGAGELAGEEGEVTFDPSEFEQEETAPEASEPPATSEPVTSDPQKPAELDTDDVVSENKTAGTKTTKDGTVWAKAPAGGLVSAVNQQFYKGGQWMPIHGRSAGLGSQPAGDSQGGGMPDVSLEGEGKGGKKKGEKKPRRAERTRDRMGDLVEIPEGHIAIESLVRGSPSKVGVLSDTALAHLGLTRKQANDLKEIYEMDGGSAFLPSGIAPPSAFLTTSPIDPDWDIRAKWEQHKKAKGEAARQKDGDRLQQILAEEAKTTPKPDASVPSQLQSIPIGDLARVGGVMVRRTAQDEYRVETQAGKRASGVQQTADERDAGVVRGGAAKIAAHIADIDKQDKMYGRQRSEALARVADFEEPSFMDTAALERGRKGFAALPVGSPVVSLEPETHGRVGHIVDDGGRKRVKFEGEDGFASSYVEPLDAKLSWRKPPEVDKGPKQSGMFGEPSESAALPAAPPSSPTMPPGFLAAMRHDAPAEESDYPPNISDTEAAPVPSLRRPIADAVAAHADEKGAGIRFDDLFQKVKAEHPSLTPLAFQQTLAAMHNAGDLRLSGWPLTLQEIPDPSLALAWRGKSMFYVNATGKTKGVEGEPGGEKPATPTEKAATIAGSEGDAMSQPAAFTAKTYRGTGRTDKDAVYNPLVKAVGGVLGNDAEYHALTPEHAKKYGPNVSEQEVSLHKPLVINSDLDWRGIAAAAGVPANLAKHTLYGGDASEVKAAQEKLLNYLKSAGYDGIVVKMDKGKPTKTIGELFGHDQIVKMPGPHL